ncbi:Alpha/Beta hydrolase protein [Entophlyctis helioformis]|nr:Alpha/Beta hydrolase protein [Entophlyctis helioformis]
MAVSTNIVLSCVATTAAVLYAYNKMVPARNVAMGNLADVTDASSPFKEDFWPSSAYVDLPFGKTHYYLLGPEDGKKVVFVHGITSPGSCYPSFINALVESGHRVLVYDHYGRGFSAAPGAIYSEQLYVAQLALLLHKLGWTKTSIIGYSLGGAITANFVATYPEMVDRIVFVAPTGLMKRLPRAAVITKIPILGPLFFHTFGRSTLARMSSSTHLIKPSENKDIAHLVDLTVFQIKNHPGYLRAFFSTSVDFKFGGNDDVFAKIEETHKGKTIAIWGAKDTVVPYNNAIRLKEIMPTIQIHTIEQWGHSIVAEVPLVVAGHVTDHLSRA